MYVLCRSELTATLTKKKEPTEKHHTVYSPLVQQIFYNDGEGHRFVVPGKG
jgi:hypothetical protein